MPEDQKDQPQTEQTRTGYTVPAAKRNEFFGRLEKGGKPAPVPRPQQSGMRGKGNRRPPPRHSSGRGK
jgi:hypothetical protein